VGYGPVTHFIVEFLQEGWVIWQGGRIGIDEGREGRGTFGVLYFGGSDWVQGKCKRHNRKKRSLQVKVLDFLFLRGN